MPTCPVNSRTLRLAPLAACLSAVLGLTLSAAHADERPAPIRAVKHRSSPAFELPAYLREKPAKPHTGSKHSSNRQPTPRLVDTCADDGSPGSLRMQVAAAMNGDTIDLSQLMCSTITLDNTWTPPHIEVNQDSLYLKGPAAGAASLTIDAGNHSSVFEHFGTGTLGVSNLTIANGYYSSSTYPQGGCIYSSGNVALIGSVVSHCGLVSTSNSVYAKGAGLYVKGNLTLSESTITDSYALAPYAASSGGGAYVIGDFTAKYSTLSRNSALGLYGLAGGAAARGDIVILGSTISRNYAKSSGGALYLVVNPPHSATITNSTISGNAAQGAIGGILARRPLTVTSSTIAFNYGLATGADHGVYIDGSLILQSSIIANNFGPVGLHDLGGAAGTTVTGADNLVTSSTLTLPLGTLTDCPQLEPLANNGGTTLTHALRHTSPAIDHGNNAGTLPRDQRLAPRVTGVAADIGAIEWQPSETDERVLASGFDGLCDQ